MNFSDESVRQLLGNLVLLVMLSGVAGAIIWKLDAKRREKRRTRLFHERGVGGKRRD
jgi:hypothetical protein